VEKYKTMDSSSNANSRWNLLENGEKKVISMAHK
jgi:hypothetical protein